MAVLGSARLRGRSAQRAVAVLGTAVIALALSAAFSLSGSAAPAGQLIRAVPSVPSAPAAQLAPPVARPRPPVPRVVALGDSVASGAGCSCTPFPTLLSRRLAAAAGHPVVLTNAAKDGLTTDGLSQQLNDPALARGLGKATLVTVTIGANDFDPDLAAVSDCLDPAAGSCYGHRLTALSATLRATLARLHAMVPANAHVLVTGYWNVFLDGAVGRQRGSTYVQVSDALTRAVNTVLAREAAAAGMSFVDLYLPFESHPLAGLTALLAPDGDHPSALGHQLIADTLLQAARPLGVPS